MADQQPGRLSVRLTSFGLALFLLLLAGGLIAPSSADPQIAALVWGALLGIAIVGVVWPLLSMVGQRVVLAGLPTDIAADDVVDLEVDSRRTTRGCELRVGSSRWASPDPRTGRVEVRGLRRGVYPELRVTIRTSRPLGVLRVTRSWVQPLLMPLHVSPAITPHRWSPRWVGSDAADQPGAGLDLGGDTVRGVREYQPGDPAHLVHWPTTVRVDTLVVRELEPPAGVGAAVVVQLGGDPDLDDSVCARAMGLVCSILGAGGALLLCCHGLNGPVRVAPATLRDAGRTLAAAVAGPPAPPPAGWPVEVVGP